MKNSIKTHLDTQYKMKSKLLLSKEELSHQDKIQLYCVLMSNSLFWYVTFCFKITWIGRVGGGGGGGGGGVYPAEVNLVGRN